MEVTSAKHVSLCLVIAILDCLISSVMKVISNNSMTTFSLMLFSQVQGTWLIHTAYLDCSERMIYLYFCWHILAVFSCILVITVIMQLHGDRQVKKHKAAKHTNLATSVDKIYEVYSETGTGITVVDHDADSDDGHKEVIYKKSDHFNVYENYEVEKQLKEEQEINNVLETIDLMVKEQATKENNITDSDTIFNVHTISERLSPLEEFNNLHRHVDGVRASIKLHQSDIV